MVIEVVPAELYALAAVLDAAAEQADRSAAAVPEESGSGPVAPAVAAFCETVRTAGTCLGGELRWLAGAVAGPRTPGWAWTARCCPSAARRAPVTAVLSSPVELPDPPGSPGPLLGALDQLAAAGFSAGALQHLLEPAAVLRGWQGADAAVTGAEVLAATGVAEQLHEALTEALDRLSAHAETW